MMNMNMKLENESSEVNQDSAPTDFKVSRLPQTFSSLKNHGTKIILGLALVFILSSFRDDAPEPTRFKEWTWTAIKQGGIIYHMPIMVFFYGTHCNQSKNTMAEFKIPYVGEFYNKTYLCFKVNADKMKDLLQANELGVKSVPTCVYMTEKSKLIHSVAGYQNRSQLLENGHLALNKIVALYKGDKKVQ